MKKYFKKGDKVKLINEYIATIHGVSIHNVFDVIDVSPLAICVTKLGWYSRSQFNADPTSILTMTPDELNTIDTFQNKNRGFKEDERDIPLENINHLTNIKK